VLIIVDYGSGNSGSILNMLKRIGADAALSSDRGQIEKADKIILPGVGSFDRGIEQLKELGLLETLNHKVLTGKTPVLGICLGLQLFAKKSEEGKLPGLGWIDSGVVKFRHEPREVSLKIPYMGWNSVVLKKESRLFKGLESESRFYFLHSYHLSCEYCPDILATADYGYEFVAGVEKENIVGVQFHPEKSHKFGMRLLKNFVELY
jgi:glutamine amidotransferase